MATAMTPSDRVTFSKPTISPKHYIVRGPSGWTETFERKLLDAELALFLSPVAPREIAELFCAQRELNPHVEVNWFTIVGYVARTKGVSHHAVPPKVGIAFWALVEITRRERATAAN